MVNGATTKATAGAAAEATAGATVKATAEAAVEATAGAAVEAAAGATTKAAAGAAAGAAVEAAAEAAAGAAVEAAAEAAVEATAEAVAKAAAGETATGASVGAANGAMEHGSLALPYVTASPSTKENSPYQPLFAKGYNDLILRSFEEMKRWKDYLCDNPRRLMMKRARPEWLRPFFGLHIGSHSYSGIGNRSLLAATKRMAVRISRRMSDSEIAAETVHYLDAARQGTVLVSPAISPGEKRVMRAAFDAGLPTIVIMENGFTPLSKPHGEQFDACARGQLLMLSPWEHHNEKKKITAEQCQQMNLMALEISR